MNKLNKILVLSLLILIPSCHLYKLEHQLDSENAEFLSKVRYIITSKERKIFLQLPDSEKEKFREEFWKSRDPYPYTEENEFKMEYFSRIERANELFREAKPGWLTDRGKVYILLGSPSDIIKSPMGAAIYNYETWYYGNYPVLFVEKYSSGTYRLASNIWPHLESIKRGRGSALKKTSEKKLFDFHMRVKNFYVENNKAKGIIIVEIPYAAIWFKDEEGRLVATMDVHLELRDAKKNLIWEYSGTFTVDTSENELKEKSNENCRIEVPFLLEENAARLQQEKNLLHVHIKNRTGDEELKKSFRFRIKV